MKTLFFVFSLLILVSWQTANAQDVQVSTSKATYNYGDYLTITIYVSKITDSDATMHIIDASGNKSTAIPVQINNLVTTITSPNQFDSLIFKEGKYKIELQYGDVTLTTEFEVVDAGNIVMPLGSNVVVPEWASGTISDYGLLKFLADKNTLHLPGGKILKENVKIPSWYKINAQWWAEKKITDSEFVNGLDYLLIRKVIVL